MRQVQEIFPDYPITPYWKGFQTLVLYYPDSVEWNPHLFVEKTKQIHHQLGTQG